VLQNQKTAALAPMTAIHMIIFYEVQTAYQYFRTKRPSSFILHNFVHIFIAH